MDLAYFLWEGGGGGVLRRAGGSNITILWTILRLLYDFVDNPPSSLRFCGQSSVFFTSLWTILRRLV